MKKAITLSGSNQKKANGLKISSDMPKFTKFIGSCDTLKKSAAGPSAGSSLLIPSKPKRRQSYQTLERLTLKSTERIHAQIGIHAGRSVENTLKISLEQSREIIY